MTELTITATVSLPGGGTLSLEDPGVYEVAGFGPGGRTWRREFVEGRYQHGRALLGAVLAQSSCVLRVRVLGASWAQVSDRAQVLVDAFSQHAYVLTVTIDGEAGSWSCEPADVALATGGAWDRAGIAAGMQEFEVTIPRSPVPLSGAL